MSSPHFVLTTAGLQVASLALPTGPHIRISEFRIGGGVGYEPNASDSALHGALLYKGKPRAIHYYDETTITIVCEMPPEVGPFDYGEIGLFLEDGTLFALASLPEYWKKQNVAISGTPHVPVFHCLLRLAQGPSVFDLSTTYQTEITEVPNFGYVAAPGVMAGNPNALIVHEQGYLHESVMLIKNSDNDWTPVKYTFIASVPVTEAETETNTPTISSPTLLQFRTTEFGYYLFQDNRGNIRMVDSINGSTATLTKPIVPGVTAGTYGRLYQVDFAGAVFTTAQTMNLWTKINRVIGPPVPLVGHTVSSYGWNQTPLALPQGDYPTELEWDNLTRQIALCRSHLFLNPQEITTASPTRGDKSERWMNYGRIQDQVADVVHKRLYTHKNNLEWQLLNSYTRSYNEVNPWSQCFVTQVLDFGSAEAMMGFFNIGGYAEFSARSTRFSYVEWTVYRLFSLLGTIRFKAESVESMGPLRIKYKHGDGVVTSAGPLGLAGVTATEKRMFSYNIPLHQLEYGDNAQDGRSGGHGSSDENILVELYAKKLSDSRLQLKFWVAQTTMEGIEGADSGKPQLGFQLTPSDPIGLNRVTILDNPPTGSYLSALEQTGGGAGYGGWGAPNQKLNTYFFLGRPRSYELNVPWPQVTVDTANTFWGTPNSSLESGGFAGGASSNDA